MSEMEEKKSKHRKCLATGKMSFPTRWEAMWTIFRFRWTMYNRRNKIDGSRIKHRVGKIEQRRAYYCKHCRGYHLTRWSKNSYQRYSKATAWYKSQE